VKVWYPNDLRDLDPAEIARELFGEAFDNWWRLERVDASRFTWFDARRKAEWQFSSGYLIALHEVSSRQQAKDFAAKNDIWLHEEGAIHCRSTAELALVCSKRSPAPLTANMFTVNLKNGVTANVGYSTLLYRKLVALPAGEENPRLPDPTTMCTLVINGVERSQLAGVAEICLYHLRDSHPDLRFQFWPVSTIHRAPEPDDEDLQPMVTMIGELPSTSRPEAVAFYNRARESDSITAFLYYYRVLEACFEDVLRQEIAKWRHDQGVDDLELMKNFRAMNQREDIKALRAMLGQIIDQQVLDRAHRQGLIGDATADSLTEGIYARRNSIAHGRKGQHVEVLVPFAFGDELRHLSWCGVMALLAEKALKRWVVIAA